MSWTHWLEGCLVIAAVFGSTFVGARTLRRRLVPTWVAEPAAVADLVLTFSAVVLLAEALGTLHLFRWYSLIVGGLAAGFALRFVAGRLPEPVPTELEPVSARLGSRVEVGLAVVAVGGLLAQALNSILDLARHGLYDYDSLHYHLTIAARFASTGATTGVPVLGQDAATYYGANAELLHAIGLSGYRVEVASPLVNLAAMVLVLAAAAAIGALFHRTAAAVAAAGAVLALPVFGTIAAGTLSNDVFAIGCFLACVALLVWWNADGQPARVTPLLLSGLAGGLAVGTKLTVAAPLMLVFLVAAASQSSLRRAVRVLGALAVGAVVTTGYWLVRNVVAVGNPVPEVSLGIGPLKLPTPRFDQVDAANQNVLHYVTNRQVIRRFYVPGLDFAFGRAWPVLVVLGAIAVLVLVTRGSRLWRLLGIAGLLGVIAYLVTPTTAGGAEGFPFLFKFNLRYVGPALVLLAVCALASPWLRRTSGWWAGALVVVELVALARRSAWAEPSTRVVAVGAAAVVAAGIGVAVYGVRRLPRGAVRGGAAVGLAVALVLGGASARRYVDTQRYARPASPRDQLIAIGRRRSGTTAVTGLPLLASFYGPQLRGRVVYIAKVRARHEVVFPPDCAFFRDALRKERADLVVILRTADGTPLPSEEWAASIPGSKLVLANAAGAAYTLPSGVTGGCTS